MVGVHRKCVNIHYAKFEDKEMKSDGVTDYTNKTPSKHFCFDILYFVSFLVLPSS